MQTATFRTLEGAIDDDPGHSGDVAQFEKIASDREVPVVFLNFLLEQLNAGVGALQTLVRADNANVVPHQSTDFVPIMGDNDQFVRIMGVAGLPGWNIGFGSRRRMRKQVLSGAMGAD